MTRENGRIMKTRSAIIAASLIFIFAFTSLPFAGELVYIEGVDDRAEVSYASTNGNTDTMTISGKIKTTRYIEEFKITAKGAILRTESSGIETEDKLKFEILAERDLAGRLFIFGSFSYLRDTFAGYDYRIFAGPGLGYTVIDTEERLFQALTSVLYNYDNYSIGPTSSDENVSLKITGKYSQHLTERISFKEILDYTASLEDMNRYFIDSETKFEMKLDDTFSLALSYIINYQNKPPSSVIKKTDTTIFTSIIADF